MLNKTITNESEFLNKYNSIIKMYSDTIILFKDIFINKNFEMLSKFGSLFTKGSTITIQSCEIDKVYITITILMIDRSYSQANWTINTLVIHDNYEVIICKILDYLYKDFIIQ